MVFFTIIAAYYQGVTDDTIFKRFINSLGAQKFKDFEVVVIHDGKLDHNIDSIAILLGAQVKIIETEERRNLWGHNLRRIGLEMAKGEYIIHTNCDNVYYPNALKDLWTLYMQTKSDILIGAVRMMGLNSDGNRIWYDKPRDYTKSHILTGRPPTFGNIDMMSLCSSKRLWDKYGWYDLSETSDGIIYSRMCKENNYEYTNTLIGEHY